MDVRSTSGLIVATSAGAPMRSARPKPIHLLCGRAMASYVLETVAAAGARQTVVVTGPDGGRVAKRLLEDPPGSTVRFAEQQADLGLGDAVLTGLQAFDDLDAEGQDLIIVPADVPLLRPSTLRLLLDAHRDTGAACTVLTADADHPHLRPAPNWKLADRIVRDRHGRVAAIDTDDSRLLLDDESESEPDEISLGIYCVRRSLLAPALRRSSAERLDGPVRISDIVEVLVGTGHICETATIDHPADLIPVNDRLQLAEAEGELRRRTNQHWLSMGVTMVDPASTYIDVTVKLGTDITIFPGTILQGATVVGNGCELGPDVRLDRCSVGNNCRIEKTSASLAAVGDDCVVGPFAVLSPGSQVPNGTQTGPFYAGGISS